jgi:3-oxoacyl-(acyl-carrier-protein) synthase
MKRQRKVVVTGIGQLSSVGDNLDDFTKKTNDGHSEIGVIKNFENFKIFNGAKVHNNEIKPIDNLSGLSSWIALCIKNALRNAIFPLSEIKKLKTYLILGTFMGEIGQSSDEFQCKKFDSVAKNVKSWLNFNIETLVISSACASANIAIGIGRDLIKHQIADLVLVGGYEAIGDFVIAGMNSLRTLANNIKPFDATRNGTVLGEGAGILLLESESTALKRKANIYAEIAGYGITNDAYHLLRPNPEGSGIIKAIKMALDNAAIKTDKIDFINTHGTGTKYNDSAECKAIINVFGELSKTIPITSIKPIIGHTLGAAGILEAISTISSINFKIIPPTINSTVCDEGCDLNIIKNKSFIKDIDYALSNSFGFGGVNSVLVLSKYMNTFKENKINERIISCQVCNAVNYSFKTQDVLPELIAYFNEFITETEISNSDLQDIGIVIDVGAGIFNTQELFWQQIKWKGIRYVSPTLFVHSFPGSFAGEICINLKITGPSITICDSDNSWNKLQLIAQLMIKERRTKYVIICKLINNSALISLVKPLNKVEFVQITNDNQITEKVGF